MTELFLVKPASVRARRAPRAVFVLWAWEASLALVLGSSFASVARQAYGRHPDGDLPLFAPGALPLLDLLHHARVAAAPLATETLCLFVVASLFGLVPTATAFAEMSFVTAQRRQPRLRDALSRAAPALPGSLAILTFTRLVQGLFGGVGALLSALLSGWSETKWGQPTGDLVFLGGLAATLAALSFVGAMAEVARGAIVRSPRSVSEALGSAVDGLRGRVLSTLWSYVWRTAASGALIAIGVYASLGLGGRSGRPLVALFLIHQLVVLARVAVQGSWMARCVRALPRPFSARD